MFSKEFCSKMVEELKNLSARHNLKLVLYFLFRSCSSACFFFLTFDTTDVSKGHSWSAIDSIWFWSFSAETGRSFDGQNLSPHQPSRYPWAPRWIYRMFFVLLFGKTLTMAGWLCGDRDAHATQRRKWSHHQHLPFQWLHRFSFVWCEWQTCPPSFVLSWHWCYLAGGDLLISTTQLKHEMGRAVLHHGQQTHSALSVISGERLNLIIWCSCVQKFDMWFLLPLDLQRQVLQLLEPNDLLSYTSCCKKTRSFRETPVFWKQMDERFHDIFPPPKRLPKKDNPLFWKKLYKSHLEKIEAEKKETAAEERSLEMQKMLPSVIYLQLPIFKRTDSFPTDQWSQKAKGVPFQNEVWASQEKYLGHTSSLSASKREFDCASSSSTSFFPFASTIKPSKCNRTSLFSKETIHILTC